MKKELLKNKESKNKNNKYCTKGRMNGITLIALVITIIVLLILAGVTMAAITGEGGILNEAQEAVLENQRGEIKEKVQMQILDSYDEVGELDKNILRKNIEDNLRVNEDDIIIEEDGSMTFPLDGYIVEIDKDGNIEVTGNGTAESLPPKLNESDIKFYYSPSNLTNEEVRVTIMTEIKGYMLQYRTDEIEWTKYPEEGITVSENGAIYARLANSQGQSGKGYATGNVENIDRQAPETIQFSNVAKTTSSIKIMATATDADQTKTDACSGIRELEFSYSDDSGQTWKEEQTKTNTVVTGEGSKTYSQEVQWTGMTQNKEYKVKVKATDYANNSKELTYDQVIMTDAVPNLQSSNLIFDYKPTTPTNTSVTVTLRPLIDISGYTLEYKTDNIEWKEYPEEGITVNENGVIYARLTDIAGQTGNTDIYATGNVENIDRQDPETIQFSGVAKTTNTIKITATAIDAGQTKMYACSGIKELKFSYSDDNGQTWKGEQTKTNTVATGEGSKTYSQEVQWTGLIQKKGYKVKVKATDYANNSKELTYDQVITTDTVPTGGNGLTGSNIEFSYSPANTQWAQTRTVTMKNNVGSNYSIEYSFTGNQGDWEAYTDTGVQVTKNGPLYARLRDSSGQSGGSATYNETMIDTTKPTIKSPLTTGTKTLTSIVLNVSANDGSGSGIDSYEYFLNGTSKNKSDTGSYTFTGLQSNTEYTLKVVVKDRVGLSSEASLTAKTNQATISDLTPGVYVKYTDKNNTVRPCRVLYNDVDHGLQIITSDVVSQITLGYASSLVSASQFTYSGSYSFNSEEYKQNFCKAAASYNYAVNILNSQAKTFMDTNGIATDVRSVGSKDTLVGGKFYDDTTTSMDYPSSSVLPSGWGLSGKMKVGDTNSLLDYDKMSQLGLLKTTSSKSYWMAGRLIDNNSLVYQYGVRWCDGTSLTSGSLVKYDKEKKTIVWSNLTDGLRPVFLLSNTVKVSSGDGKSANTAYVLEPSDLAPGVYVKYTDKNNTVRPCRVLYNDVDHGLQIITSDVVSQITLGYASSLVSASQFTYSGSYSFNSEEYKQNFCKAAASYNYAVNILNSQAKTFMDTNGIATDVRSVGSKDTLVGGKFYDDTTTSMDYPSSSVLPSGWGLSGKMKVGDTNSLLDYDKMSQLGLLKTTSSKSYWMAGRLIDNNSLVYQYGVRWCDGTSLTSGSLVKYDKEKKTIVWSNLTDGLRPVFLLSNTVKVSSGDGKSANTAYVLGK